MQYLIKVDDDPENPRRLFQATEFLKKRTDMRPYYGPLVINGKVVKQDIPKSQMNVTPPGIAKPLSLKAADLVDQSNAERELARQVNELEAENEALYKEIAELKEEIAKLTVPAEVIPIKVDEPLPAGTPVERDPDDVQTKIIAAMVAIKANPQEGDLTNGGQVKVRAIEKHLGFSITSDERDKAVEAMSK